MELFQWDYEKHPRFMQIETTIICNAHCPFCPHKNSLRKPTLMEWGVLEKILAETRGLGITYRPFILNEPFADKRMPDIVALIKQDPTAKVEFNSNGELVSEKVAEKVLENGVDIMRFSVDGIERKTFDESRGINFDRVYKNVEYFLKLAAQAPKPPHVEVRMIKLPGTEEEQIRYKEYWQERGANVVFTMLYRYPWEGQTESIQKPCLKILDEMFIYVHGRVTLCCWDSTERAVVGDVTKEGVLDIWNGVMLKRYRDLLARGQRDQITLCSRCDAYKHLDFSKIKGKQGNVVLFRDQTHHANA